MHFAECFLVDDAGNGEQAGVGARECTIVRCLVVALLEWIPVFFARLHLRRDVGFKPANHL